MLILLATLTAASAQDAPASPISLPGAVQAFTLSQSPVRSGPNRASLGPVMVKRLITRVDVEQLAVTAVTPTQVSVTGALVVKVNGPKRPFVVTADMGVTESSCEGWFNPLAVPVALTVDFAEATRADGSPGVRAHVALNHLGLDGLPVAENLVFCDLAGSSGVLLGAAVGWAQGSSEALVAMYEQQLNAYLLSLPGLSLRPAAAPVTAPNDAPILIEPQVY